MPSDPAAEVERLRRYQQVTHPGLVRLVAVGFDESALWVRFAPFSGSSLDLLASRTLADVRARLACLPSVQRVCDAVVALHGAGLAHGGVIVENVRVGDGRTVLVGFRFGALEWFPRLGSAAADDPASRIRGDVSCLGRLLREVVTGETKGYAGRPDRWGRYAVGAEFMFDDDDPPPEPPAEEPLPEPLLELAARAERDASLDAATFARELGAWLAPSRLRAQRDLEAEDAARGWAH